MTIKRDKIIETLKIYKIDARIINAIANIYNEDTIELCLGELKETITATNGIRQGCTLSATIFKLISYRIIKELNQKVKGYQTKEYTIRTLFFADDGLIISESVNQTACDIKILQSTTSKYGLELNKGKSSVLIFNMKNKPDNIEGISISDQMKYLGVLIQDTRDIFKKHKMEKIKLAEKLANCTYSIVNRSCSRSLIGKTYWKSVAVPAIIYASGVINWNRSEIESLQVKQNQVCRKIYNAPRWATNTALRGEIGMSTMESRIIQSKTGYIVNRLNQGSNLIKGVVEEL